MKTIDMRITGSDDVVICPSVVRDALQNYFPEKYFTVTELPPPQVGDWRNELANELENSLDEIIYEVSPAERYRIADIVRNWQPAARGAPAVERQINAPDIPIKRPTANGCLIIGCREYDRDSNICLHIGACPHTMFDAKPRPSCEKLKGELNRMQGKTNTACQTCGAKTTMIRGKYPHEDKREVCPTCLAERMDQIKDISDKDYGKAWQDKSALNQPKEVK